MTRDEIIRMAREAGAFPELSETPEKDIVFLRRFAALVAAAELRRLHAEVEELREANQAFGKRQEWWNEKMFQREEQADRDEALMRQVLNDLCGSRLCSVNSMSSRREAKRLIDRAITALRERLGVNNPGVD